MALSVVLAGAVGACGADEGASSPGAGGTAAAPRTELSAVPAAPSAGGPTTASAGRGTADGPDPTAGTTEATAATDATVPAPGDLDAERGDAVRSFAVATRRETFVDGARGRTLATTIYFPADAPPPQARAARQEAVEADAAARPVARAFPLVLMVHGYLLPGDGYDRLTKTVAAAGYVVAAPELPHTTGHGGDGLRSDITNQPADLAFVADQVIALGAGGSGSIPAISDPTRFAVVGHSDGGLTATAFGYGQQFRDTRVAAVVSLTAGIGLFPGPYFTGADLPPLLAVHARDDSTNPYRASASLFASVPAGRPRFLLTIAAGGHIDPYMFATGRIDLGDAIAAFLDLTLLRDPDAEARLRAAAASPDLTLEAAG